MERRRFLTLIGGATLTGGVISLHDAPAAESAWKRRGQFGMNLTGIADWVTELPFADLYRTARPWKKSDAELAAIKTDPHGNHLLKPGEFVEYFMLTISGGRYPAGTYVCTYEGKGKVELNRHNVKRIISERPGRIEAEIEPKDGAPLVLTIRETDAIDPVRNVHIYLPGQDSAKSPWNPPFVEGIKPFGTLRFMDWQSTNGSPVRTWTQRAKPDDARYSTPAGVPLEVMIQLANDTASDPWFCMPHLADDDYIRRFAAIVKQQLDPARKAYIEFSNECWNGGFEQARWCSREGIARKLSDNAFQAQLFFYSQRSVNAFRIWDEVFGPDARKRLVRVMGSQSVNPWVSEQVLTFQDAYKSCDALAIAPYFGNDFGSPKRQDEIAAMPVERLMDEVAKEVAGENREVIRKQVDMARRFKVELMAYEGGQHFVGHGGAENNEKLTALLIAANRHPRMYDLYRAHLKNWIELGGGLYVAFSNVSQPSKWGSWGAKEYQGQPLAETPKYRALLDTIKT